MKKSYQEINDKIRQNKAVVLTAEEMTQLVQSEGPEAAARKVDVVTTGTFGAMCSSGVFMNFGHTDPPLKMERISLNGVKVYGGIAAVDGYLGATEKSQAEPETYGGAHVIEDLIRRKPLSFHAEGQPTGCYPGRSADGMITLDDLNQAVMLNPRNAYQRYNAAANTSDRPLHTYMGKLLPHIGNVTYSGAGELSPLNNDPQFRTIGTGTRIFLGGAEGYIVGSGTQHSPTGHFATLMLQGDLKTMDPEFIRAATFPHYGHTLYVGIGIPIPILDEAMALATAVSDREITVSIIDYGVPHLRRPAIRSGVSYQELKSGWVEIEGRSIKTYCLSSLITARKIALTLKSRIEKGLFLLSEPVAPLSRDDSPHPFRTTEQIRESEPMPVTEQSPQRITLDPSRCVRCGMCTLYCQFNALTQGNDGLPVIDRDRCTLCLACIGGCQLRCLTLSASGRV